MRSVLELQEVQGVETAAVGRVRFGRIDAAHVLAWAPPLMYTRQPSAWAAASSAVALTRAYSCGWVGVQRTDAAERRACLLVGARGAARSDGAPSATRAWQAAATLLDADDSGAPSLAGALLALTLAQQLMPPPPRLVLLTRGALTSSSAAHGGAWGIARVARLEHAALRLQSVDTRRSASSAEAAAALLGASAEAEAAWRGEARLAARLRACDAAAARDEALPLGAHLVTGGLGGLGLRAGALLLERGARRVVLASRGGAASLDGRTLQGPVGATAVAVVACDGAEAGDVGALVQRGALVGVLHTAGVGDKGLLQQLAAVRLAWVHAPKAAAAWRVHGAAVAAALECLVVWSSVGSGLGHVGQASYACANAWLDAHARSRRVGGSAASSGQWPLVGGAGMGAAAHAAAAERQAGIAGLAGISLEEYAAWLGLQLGVGVGAEQSVRLVHRSEAGALLRDVSDASERRFGEVAAMAAVASTGDGAPALAAEGGAVEGGALAQVLAPLAPAQRLAHVEGAVLRVVRELAGGGAATVAGETPLMEAGVDSLAATELASRLRLSTGVALSPTVVFEHPSARAVAVHVVEQVVVEQVAAARQGAVVRRVERAAGGVMVRSCGAVGGAGWWWGDGAVVRCGAGGGAGAMGYDGGG